jgi:hypothetical protein
VKRKLGGMTGLEKFVIAAIVFVLLVVVGARLYLCGPLGLLLTCAVVGSP